MNQYLARLALLLSVTLLGACLGPAVSKLAIEPATTYQQRGASVYSPADKGWIPMQVTDRELAFARNWVERNESAAANTRLIEIPGQASDREFLNRAAARRTRQNDPQRFRNVDERSVQLAFKGTACLQYHSLQEDHGNAGIDSQQFQYLNTQGYICRHPANRDVAFLMELSHVGAQRQLPEAIERIAEAFFNGIRFDNQGMR